MKSLKSLLEGRNQCWVHPNESVREAVAYMCECKTGAMLVKEGETAIGVFSERDLMHRVVNEGKDPKDVLVKDVMSYNIHRIHINDDTEMAKAIMYANHVRHLMVVDEQDEVMGMVSIRDLVEHELSNASEIIRNMNDAYYEKAYRPKWFVSSNRVIVERYHPKSR